MASRAASTRRAMASRALATAGAAAATAAATLGVTASSGGVDAGAQLLRREEPGLRGGDPDVGESLLELGADDLTARLLAEHELHLRVDRLGGHPARSRAASSTPGRRGERIAAASG